MLAPSLWPVISSGWAFQPILANKMEEEVCWEALGRGFFADNMRKDAPLFLY